MPSLTYWSYGELNQGHSVQKIFHYRLGASKAQQRWCPKFSLHNRRKRGETLLWHSCKIPRASHCIETVITRDRTQVFQYFIGTKPRLIPAEDAHFTKNGESSQGNVELEDEVDHFAGRYKGRRDRVDNQRVNPQQHVLLNFAKVWGRRGHICR